jgi:formylglycine-generating enzyme required for sulfatase activity
VQQYEANGASPFGIVDLSGNVWEWCLTDFDSGSTNITDRNFDRVLRGGSWYGNYTTSFRCDCRDWNTSGAMSYYWGFRLAIS